MNSIIRLNWKYKNTFFLISSLLILYFIADTAIIKNFIKEIGDLGYLGAFLVGIFFVSIFTVAPSIIIIYYLAEYLNPWEVAILAGLGATMGDLIIFRFLKNNIFSEWSSLLRIIRNDRIKNFFNSPYFSWILPIIGALIIISPFPDEIGIGLMGLSKIKKWQFMLISFALNSLGIFIIVALANIK